jgi:hypothetical protein
VRSLIVHSSTIDAEPGRPMGAGYWLDHPDRCPGAGEDWDDPGEGHARVCPVCRLTEATLLGGANVPWHRRRSLGGAGPRGNSNPSGLGGMEGRDGQTGETLAPNHWWWQP